jgi:hypothetical protein
MPQEIPFGDKNLQDIVSQFYRTEKDMTSTTGKLGEKSRTKFSCKDSDTGSYLINILTYRKSYFEIMDALSSIRNFGWNRTGEYHYQLDDSMDDYEKTFKRVDNFDRSRSQAALPFMKMIDNLSATELGRLKNIEERGVPFQEFPKDIQNSLREVARIYESESEKNKGFSTKIEKGRIYVNLLPSPGFHHMLIGFNIPGHSLGLGVHDFEDWKARQPDSGKDQIRMNYKKSKIIKSKWSNSKEAQKKLVFKGILHQIKCY